MLTSMRRSVSSFKSSIGRKNLSTSSSGAEVAPESYSAGVQFFHWTVGGAILASVGLVQVAQYKKGKEKMDIMFYHKSFGLLAGALIAPRLLMRFVSKTPAHVPGPAVEQLSAQAMHILLYGFMIFMPFSGIAMGYFGGKGLPFFYTTIPGAEKADGFIAKNAFDMHKLVGHYAQFLIPIHVGGAAFHYFVKGNNIMPRILSIGAKAAKK